MHTVRPATLSGHPSLEPVLVAKTHAFVATQFREPAHHFVWHYHPETELTWNRQGQGMRYVGQSVARFEAGDLVLVRGNVPHTWASAPEQRGEAIWTALHLSIASDSNSSPGLRLPGSLHCLEGFRPLAAVVRTPRPARRLLP